jgi:hypothetical protein
MWNGHYAVLTVLLLASIVLPSLLSTRFANGEFFKPLVVLQQKIMDEPEISHASVFEGQNWSSSGTGTKKATDLPIAAFLKERGPDENLLANKIAEIAFNNNPRASEKNLVSITFGLRLRHWNCLFLGEPSIQLSLQQWQEKLKAKR